MRNASPETRIEQVSDQRARWRLHGVSTLVLTGATPFTLVFGNQVEFPGPCRVGPWVA